MITLRKTILSLAAIVTLAIGALASSEADARLAGGPGGSHGSSSKSRHGSLHRHGGSGFRQYSSHGANRHWQGRHHQQHAYRRHHGGGGGGGGGYKTYGALPAYGTYYAAPSYSYNTPPTYRYNTTPSYTADARPAYYRGPCLTKEYAKDGGVWFKDVCTKEEAYAEDEEDEDDEDDEDDTTPSYSYSATPTHSYGATPTATPSNYRGNCLTKEYTENGGVLFKDVCTGEQASTDDDEEEE